MANQRLKFFLKGFRESITKPLIVKLLDCDLKVHWHIEICELRNFSLSPYSILFDSSNSIHPFGVKSVPFGIGNSFARSREIQNLCLSIKSRSSDSISTSSESTMRKYWSHVKDGVVGKKQLRRSPECKSCDSYFPTKNPFPHASWRESRHS